MTSMMREQSIEQRIDAHGHGMGCQTPCIGNCGGQHANPADEHQLAILPCCKGKAEHPAKVFDAHHFGCEDIRHTDRIDKLDTHGTPQIPLHADQAWCLSWVGESTAKVRARAFVSIHGFQFLTARAA